MKTLQIALTVEENGRPIDGSPFIRRINVDESQQFEVEQPTDPNAYVTPPIGSLDQVNFLLLTIDQATTIRFAGQTDGGMPLNAGALVLIIDGAIESGSAVNNVLVRNPSGVTALLKGLAGGT